jgi:hypothetical protein
VLEVARLWNLDPADVERMDRGTFAAYVAHAQTREQVEGHRVSAAAERAVERLLGGFTAALRR